MDVDHGETWGDKSPEFELGDANGNSTRSFCQVTKFQAPCRLLALQSKKMFFLFFFSTRLPSVSSGPASVDACGDYILLYISVLTDFCHCIVSFFLHMW